MESPLMCAVGKDLRDQSPREKVESFYLVSSEIQHNYNS